MEWLIEPFALGFQQRALAAGILAGLMSAVVGTWIVLRGMSFFGDAFVHGIIPGIAVAVVLDINPVIGAAVAAVVMVALIEIVHRQTSLGEDTACRHGDQPASSARPMTLSSRIGFTPSKIGSTCASIT